MEEVKNNFDIDEIRSHLTLVASKNGDFYGGVATAKTVTEFINKNQLSEEYQGLIRHAKQFTGKDLLVKLTVTDDNIFFEYFDFLTNELLLRVESLRGIKPLDDLTFWAITVNIPIKFESPEPAANSYSKSKEIIVKREDRLCFTFPLQKSMFY